MKCTWVDCQREGVHPQIAKDGEKWATLCDAHNDLLDEALDSGDPKRILSSWVTAGGGAKTMAARMMR